MIRIALLALLGSCVPAAAQDMLYPTSPSIWGNQGWYRMELIPGEDECFAFILVEDRHGTYNETETLDTSEGPVSVEYTTVGMHSGEPDFATVVSTPPGVIARPMHLDLVPGEKRPICLMRWIGG